LFVLKLVHINASTPMKIKRYHQEYLRMYVSGALITRGF
jgi:hypothetical protein